MLLSALPSFIREIRFYLARTTLAAGVLATVGCQTYVSVPLDPQVTAAGFGKRRLDDPQVRQALVASKAWSASRGWPPAPWTLRQLQVAALHYHPEIAVAKAKARTAEAAITTANARPNPTLAFAPEFGDNPGAGVSPWVFGFSLDLTIETAHKRGERTSQAQAKANSAALSIADAAWTVSSGVRAALLDLESASRRFELLEAQRENDDAIVKIVAERVRSGEAPHTDLSVPQTQRGKDSVDLSDERSKGAAAKAKLAQAVGLPATSLTAVAVSYGSLDKLPEMPSEKSLRRAALIHRSDILGALEDYAAADSALRLEIAKQYPDIHLSPGYTFDQGQSKWALGLGMTLPVDRNAGPIREAFAQRDEAAAVFERLQIGIRGELEQAVAAYQAERRRVREVEAVMDSQARQLDDAEQLTKAGEGDRLAENTARSLLLQSKLARTDALTQAHQAFGRLLDAARISPDEN